MIAEAAIVTALATGALGSAHCAAMCGPLAVAGCSRNGAMSGREVASYLAGRAAAYSAVGAVLGHLGRHALCILPMRAIEGIALGLVAIAAAYRGVTLLRSRRAAPPLVPLRAKRKRSPMAALLAELWPRRGLGLGIATGVLPCGLLVPAWALAAGTASAPAGALVMFAFSIATLPGLLVPLLGRRLAQALLAKLPAYAPGLAWCALAAWVSVRPLLIATGYCH